MDLRTIVWASARRDDYSQRAASGRLFQVALPLIASFPVIVELWFWHGRWDHLAIYGAMWLVAAALGRLMRLVMARE
jgi:hypothetical protein